MRQCFAITLDRPQIRIWPFIPADYKNLGGKNVQSFGHTVGQVLCFWQGRSLFIMHYLLDRDGQSVFPCF